MTCVYNIRQCWFCLFHFFKFLRSRFPNTVRSSQISPISVSSFSCFLIIFCKFCSMTFSQPFLLLTFIFIPMDDFYYNLCQWFLKTIFLCVVDSLKVLLKTSFLTMSYVLRTHLLWISEHFQENRYAVIFHLHMFDLTTLHSLQSLSAIARCIHTWFSYLSFRLCF